MCLVILVLIVLLFTINLNYHQRQKLKEKNKTQILYCTRYFLIEGTFWFAKNDGQKLKTKTCDTMTREWPPSPPRIYDVFCSPLLYMVGFFLRFIDFMIFDIVESFCMLLSAALRLSKLHFSAISCNNGSASFTSKNLANRLSSPIVFCLNIIWN